MDYNKTMCELKNTRRAELSVEEKMESVAVMKSSCLWWKAALFFSVVAVAIAGTAGFFIGQNHGRKHPRAVLGHKQVAVNIDPQKENSIPLPDLTVEEAFRILKKEDAIYTSVDEFWAHARKYLKGFESLDRYDYLDKIVSNYRGSSFLQKKGAALPIFKAFLKEGAVFKEDSLFYIITVYGNEGNAFVELMLDHGCLPMARWDRKEGFLSSTGYIERGDQPLHVIARRGNLEQARILLDHGADINGLNAEEETPLDCVSLSELKDYLITRGGKFSYEL